MKVQIEATMANVSPQASAGFPVVGGLASGQPETGASERNVKDLNYGYFKAWHVLGWVVFIFL